MIVQFRNLWKKCHIMTITVIHPQASRADQLPGKLQQSREKVSWPLTLALDSAVWAGWQNRSCHSTAQLPPHICLEAPCSSICSATAHKVQNSPGVQQEKLLKELLIRCYLPTPSKKYTTNQTSSNKTALRLHWSLEVLQNTLLTVNIK